MKIKDVLNEMSKKDDALTLYKQLVLQGGMGRQAFIQELVKQLGMTPAGAGTYYQMAKTHHAGATPAAPAAPVAPVTPAIVAAPRAAAPVSAPAASAPNGPPGGEAWLKSKKVNAKINAQGVFDVQGDVDLGAVDEKELPVAFGHVTGNFLCSGGELRTLKGSPATVDGDYFVDHNQLSGLAGSPTSVGMHVTVSGNDQLATLEGISQQIGGKLYLQSLPSLKSLQNIHKMLKSCGGVIDMTGTPIASNVLGLLMVKKLPSIKMDNKKVMEIINKHLGADRDIHQCQEELLEAGLAEFARL